MRGVHARGRRQGVSMCMRLKPRRPWRTRRRAYADASAGSEGGERPALRASGTHASGTRASQALLRRGRSRCFAMPAFARDLSCCVRKRTHARPMGTGRVRLCTHCPMACAMSDMWTAEWRRSCPFVHTGRPRVCKVGHEVGRMAPIWSVCAHATPTRVLFRTRGRRFGRLRVRLCTRDTHACAKSDTRLAVSGHSCPFLHTLSYGVCFSGHAEADSGGHASVCAHGTPTRVQSRTQDWPYRAVLVRFCTPSSAPCAQADKTTSEGPGTSPHARGANGRRARAAGRNDYFELTRAPSATASLRGRPSGASHEYMCGMREPPEANPHCVR